MFGIHEWILEISQSTRTRSNDAVGLTPVKSIRRRSLAASGRLKAKFGETCERYCKSVPPTPLDSSFEGVSRRYIKILLATRVKLTDKDSQAAHAVF
jgi:hypothetical protein